MEYEVNQHLNLMNKSFAKELELKFGHKSQSSKLTSVARMHLSCYVENHSHKFLPSTKLSTKYENFTLKSIN